uniref:Uncharacterized protein n=1 Tax=Mesocestoides corti TaxID=53468 RepID=A0A5K3G2Y5_MESCO
RSHDGFLPNIRKHLVRSRSRIRAGTASFQFSRLATDGCRISSLIIWTSVPQQRLRALGYTQPLPFTALWKKRLVTKSNNLVSRTSLT